MILCIDCGNAYHKEEIQGEVGGNLETLICIFPTIIVKSIKRVGKFCSPIRNIPVIYAKMLTEKPSLNILVSPK